MNARQKNPAGVVWTAIAIAALAGVLLWSTDATAEVPPGTPLPDNQVIEMPLVGFHGLVDRLYRVPGCKEWADALWAVVPPGALWTNSIYMTAGTHRLVREAIAADEAKQGDGR